MLAISTSGVCLPEPACHLLAADIAPAERKISFICNLIEYARFSILRAPDFHILCGTVQIDSLQTAVHDPSPGMIVHGHTVVNGAQMAVRILTADGFCIGLPLGYRFPAEQVKFICHSPPDIVVCAETVDNVS